MEDTVLCRGGGLFHEVEGMLEEEACFMNTRGWGVFPFGGYLYSVWRGAGQLLVPHESMSRLLPTPNLGAGR